MSWTAPADGEGPGRIFFLSVCSSKPEIALIADDIALLFCGFFENLEGEGDSKCTGAKSLINPKSQI